MKHKLYNERFKTNFWDVDWGPDEAKGDTKLSTYFIRIPEYEGIKRGEYRYIIGRKGTGKTAIIEQLMNEVEKEYNQFHKYLSLKNFPIQTIRNLKDRSMGDKSQFVPIWTFLILTELAKLIIQDQSSGSFDEIQILRDFIKLNFPDDLGFSETLKRLQSNENKVSVVSKWLNIENKKASSDELTIPIHYQKATEFLYVLIKQINSNCVYFIFFDELDEGYSAEDKGLNLLLLALFRAIENTFLDLKGVIDFKPVLALRSDIFNNLEDNDLNKLDDYLINLKWTTESYSSYSLYDLVIARINASLKVETPNNAWECISYNHDEAIPYQVKSLWDFIYNRTFERPRDILKFLKCCKKLNAKGRLNYAHVQRAEIDYSEWFYKEFRDEVQSHLPVWQEAAKAITSIGRGIFTAREIKIEFDKSSEIASYIASNKKKHEDILETLFNFGLIGTLSNSNRWFFKYKDSNLPFDPDQRMIVHFGFLRKLRLSNPYKRI